jgi:hypothetical protein
MITQLSARSKCNGSIGDTTLKHLVSAYHAVLEMEDVDTVEEFNYFRCHGPGIYTGLGFNSALAGP